MTTNNSSSALALAAKVIDPPATGEDEVEAAIKALLRNLGYECHSISIEGVGEADIYLPDHNLVIETKDRGKVDPDGPGSQPGETQEGQLTRYVKALHGERKQQFPLTPNAHWRGILTDGVIWHFYEWEEVDGRTLKINVRDCERPPMVDAAVLVDRLQEYVSRVRIKRSLPDDLYGIFESSQHQLRNIHNELASSQGTKTKFDLWQDMMRASGFEVDGSADDLFVNHTLLVTIAEAVIASLNEDDRQPTEILNDGFASWPQDRGTHGPMHHRGAQWVEEVFAIADSYDWRSRERDVLRHLYQDIIDRRHRKSFGEYYTPDWLAQVVIDEIIDDDWLENSVKTALSSQSPQLNGIGVLDPSCGSGTFLYHAALKILGSLQLKRQGLTEPAKGAVVARLVIGIDIHPVAVSIARATLLRALPRNSVKSADELQVWQGDSLMLDRGVGSLFNPEGRIIEVQTPQGRQISIPIAFAASPSFAVELRRLVGAATNNEPLPYGIGNGLDAGTTEGIRRLHQTLTEVCAEEGDSVWAWYLANYVAPFLLARSGVDCIVSNPPWVRMSEIQVEVRKRALETRIAELGIGAGGKNATGFDIAGLFVDQCRQHYLHGDAPAAGWVLNWGSIKAGNWARVRDKHAEFNQTFLDFSKVVNPPFTGAKACAWIQRGEAKLGPAVRTYANRNRDLRVNATDDASEFRDKTNSQIRVKHFGDAPSQYSGTTGKSFAQGAIITPSVLVKVSKFDGSTVTTTKSRHNPWVWGWRPKKGSCRPNTFEPRCSRRTSLCSGIS